jgi:outer membrane protein assembly factor BamB
MKRFRRAGLVIFGAVTVVAAGLVTQGASAAPSPAKYNWLQFGYNESKSADDTAESAIGAGNVADLKQLFKVPLTDVPDGSPLYLSNVTTAKGVQDLVFLQGEHGHLTALNAHTGATVWSDDFGPGEISNSTPAIDPAGKYIYINADDGEVHKVAVGTGTEVKTGGWPVSVGSGKSSSSLTIATAANGNVYLYASNQGHGRTTTIDLTTGTKHVFDAACANQPDTENPAGCTVDGADPWARGPAFDPALNEFFTMGGTNNGDTWVPGQVYRQSLIGLPADGHTTVRGGGGYPEDSFTPANWLATVKSDQDIGSGGMLILPTTLSKKYPDLGVNPGKDANIRLIDLADMSGQGGPGHLGGAISTYAFPAASEMRSQGAVWTDPANGSVWVFVPGNNGIAGFEVTVDSAGNPKLVLKWTLFNGWTSSAVMANGVLFAANGAGEHTASLALHQVQAINPTTGKVLWTGGIGLHHWSSPIVDNGVVYMVDGDSGGFGSGDTGDLIAWSLGG